MDKKLDLDSLGPILVVLFLVLFLMLGDCYCRYRQVGDIWSSSDLVIWKSDKLKKSIFNKISDLGYKNEETKGIAVCPKVVI